MYFNSIEKKEKKTRLQILKSQIAICPLPTSYFYSYNILRT